MQWNPPTVKDEALNRKLQEAAAKWNAMTPAEQEAMMDKQRKGYVAAEMSWPRDCPYR